MSEMKKCCDLKGLHVNLMEEILAWLPVESVSRCRSVSKEWNALLSSREFITNKWVKKPTNRNPWLVAVKVAGSDKWLDNGWLVQQTPVSLLGSCFFNQTWQETSSSVSLSLVQQYPEEEKDSVRYKCFGSAAGLFLFCRTRNCSRDVKSTFVVCNPLTRKFLEIPVLSLNRIVAAGIMSHSGGAYKIVVVGTIKSWFWALKVEIYDSIDKSWRVTGHLPQYVECVGRILGFYDGYFYCLALISGQATLLVYNIGEGTSMFRPLPEIADGQYMVPHLLTCGSRVLLAAHIMGDSEQILRGSDPILEVIIWELEKVKVNSSSSSSWWKEIARMPPSNFERYSINGKSCCRFLFDCIKCCVGVGDSICFMVIENMKVKDILVYDVTENTWSWLPSRTWDRCEIPMAFEPRPDMKVD